jgi:hypothetical protein
VTNFQSIRHVPSAGFWVGLIAITYRSTAQIRKKGQTLLAGKHLFNFLLDEETAEFIQNLNNLVLGLFYHYFAFLS